MREEKKNLGGLQRLYGCTHPSMDRFQDPLNFNSFYEKFRNVIEGKFGQAKRRFSLNLVMTKLPETSETSIAITFLVINLSTLLRQFNCLFLSLFLQNYKFGLISEDYIIKANIQSYYLT